MFLKENFLLKIICLRFKLKKKINSKYLKYIIFIFTFFINITLNHKTFGQKDKKLNYLKKIDSLNREIGNFTKQVDILKKTDFIKYYQAQKKLDQMIFLKNYYKSLYDEDFTNIENHLNQLKEKALLDNDKNTIEFCKKYRNELDLQIKQYHMHYQKLFTSTKNIDKLIQPYLNKNKKEELLEALNILNYALKYAKNYNFKETEKYLQNQKNYIEALLFDLESPYDLKELTENEKNFNKIFLQLLKSDSLGELQKAQEMVEHCLFYCQKIKRPIDTAFLNKQKNVVIATMADYYDRQKYYNNNFKFFDQAIRARLDSLNKPGIYKWHNKIVVINEITFKYNTENLQKGEAIIASDKALIFHLKKLKLIEIDKNLKIAGTQFIPFKDESNNIVFFKYNNETSKWQYMIAYSIVINKKITDEIIKYLPPMYFIEEENIKK